MTGDREPDLSTWSISGSFVEDGVVYPGHPFQVGTFRQIKNGEFPTSDILIATYPRSGTARLVEICWLLLNDGDIEKAKTIDINKKHSFLDATPQSADAKKYCKPIAKTHVDFKTAKLMAEKTKKVIVGIRNPKDALVSYYHYCRMNTSLGLFPGSWRQFIECYKNGRIAYGDYFDNVLSWWSERNRENILVVFYEDLSLHPAKTIKKISEFLGKDYSDDKIDQMVDYISFSNIRNQPNSNYTSSGVKKFLKHEISSYMRKGEIGDWVNYFSEEDNKYIDDLCQSRAQPAGLNFTFSATPKSLL